MSSSSDAWLELQALKSKRDNWRKRLEERKKERQNIGIPAASGSNLGSSQSTAPGEISQDTSIAQQGDQSEKDVEQQTGGGQSQQQQQQTIIEDSTDFEESVLQCLCDLALHLPFDSHRLQMTVNKLFSKSFTHDQIRNLLEKFAVQQLISIEERISSSGVSLEINSADNTKLLAMVASTKGEESGSGSRKRKGGGGGGGIGSGASGGEEIQRNEERLDSQTPDEKRPKENDDILSLLSLASTREKENKRIGEEILELLSRPSAKEKTLAEQFRSQGASVKEFCTHGTKSECRRISANKICTRVHFRKIIQSHTDESLGDCSFLNTCFHLSSCKYVHYEVDTSDRNSGGVVLTSPTGKNENKNEKNTKNENGSGDMTSSRVAEKSVLHQPQWIFCDIRSFDMTILGKFSVIMADPPWDIHMELPYGTLSDDEMRHLNIPSLQDEGLIFLWTTGRAMELGRECLQLWGYERVDELIWVKTNQLQRIIRTGRTGNPQLNYGLDCDVIVAEVRATSHKPDEVYGIIERLSPGTRKIELFGRPHNIQPNWITLGNQLQGIHLKDEELKARFYARYPDGNCK